MTRYVSVPGVTPAQVSFAEDQSGFVAVNSTRGDRLSPLPTYLSSEQEGALRELLMRRHNARSAFGKAPIGAKGFCNACDLEVHLCRCCERCDEQGFPCPHCGNTEEARQ